jgi:hypothetical protein
VESPSPMASSNHDQLPSFSPLYSGDLMVKNLLRTRDVKESFGHQGNARVNIPTRIANSGKP